MEEVTCVGTNMYKMGPEDADNEGFVIWITIEDAIKKRLRSGGKAEEEETVRIGEKLWKIEEDSDSEDEDIQWEVKIEVKTKIVGGELRNNAKNKNEDMKLFEDNYLHHEIMLS